jgi:hypothetical protein
VSEGVGGARKKEFRPALTHEIIILTYGKPPTNQATVIGAILAALAGIAGMALR